MRDEDLQHFPTYRSIRTPRIARNVAVLVASGIAIGLAFLLFVPWVQNAQGQGRVTALDPVSPQPEEGSLS